VVSYILQVFRVPTLVGLLSNEEKEPN